MRIEYGLTTLSLVLLSTAAFKFREAPGKNADHEKEILEGSVEWISRTPLVAEKSRGLSSDLALQLNSLNVPTEQPNKINSEDLSRLLGQLDDYDLYVFRERNKRAKEKRFIEGRFGLPLVRRDISSSPDLRDELRADAQAQSDPETDHQRKLKVIQELFQNLEDEDSLFAYKEVEIQGAQFDLLFDLNFGKTCPISSEKCAIAGGALYIEILVDHQVYQVFGDLNLIRQSSSGSWVAIDLSGCGPKVSRKISYLAVQVPTERGQPLSFQVLDRQQADWVNLEGSAWSSRREVLRPDYKSQDIFRCSSL